MLIRHQYFRAKVWRGVWRQTKVEDMSQPKVTAYFSSRKKASGVASLKSKGFKSAPDRIALNVQSSIFKAEEPAVRECQKTSASPLRLSKSIVGYRTPKRKLCEQHAQERLHHKRRRTSSGLKVIELSSAAGSPDHLASTPDLKINGTSRKRLDLSHEVSSLPPTVSPVKVTILKDEVELPTSRGTKVAKASISTQDEKDVFIPPPSVSELKRTSPVDIDYLLATTDFPAPISPLPPSPGKPSSSPNSESSKSTTDEPVKLNPEEVKIRLGKCGKLKDLQARLKKVSNCAAQLKQFKKKLASPRLHKFTSAAIEIPVERKDENEIKPDATTLPAYQRFHNLASATVPSLTLPYKYKVLEEMFRAVDTVVSLTQNRQELCTFSKLKAAVQVIMKRSFELHNLGQIEHVFSEAYILRQEKASNYFQSKSGGDYVLTVTGDLNFSNSENPDDKLLQTTEDNDVPESANLERTSRVHFKSMTSSVLLARRNIFHHRLVEIMKEHHEKFLTTLNPPMVVPKEKLTRWHPRFNVDEVPDIPSATLPAPPGVQFVTAKDVLETARGLYGPRVDKAMEAVVQKQTVSTECSSPSVDNTPIKLTSSPSLKGIPQSLLDKIRAKEAANLQWEMTRDPVIDQQLIMKARLPELARILRTYFVTEKKAAITIDDAVAKLVDSTHAALSPEDIKNHLQLLSELAPTWLSIIPTKKGTYLKIDKTKNLNDVLANVQNSAKNSTP